MTFALFCLFILLVTFAIYIPVLDNMCLQSYWQCFFCFAKLNAIEFAIRT